MFATIPALILSAVIAYVFIYFPFKAFKLIREGGTAITEAATQLNNERLHEAGSMINRGAGIVVLLLTISLVLSILSGIIAILSLS